MNNLKQRFNFWCQKVLPQVYDDSLSYYEAICQLAEYVNEIMVDDSNADEEIKKLSNRISILEKWVNDFNPNYIKELVEKYLATMIFPEINDAGYIVYNIPDRWDAIEFNTTGVDIEVELEPEYGHLVLSY